MLHEYLMFWLREAFSNIVRNRLMSVLAVSTVTIGLFILGGFYLTLANLQAIVANETGNLQIDVYLKQNVSPERRKEIYDAAHMPQVRKLTIETKEQVLENMKRDYPKVPVNDFQGENNPFPNILHILVKNPQDLMKVRDYLASIQGVDEADAPGDTQKVLQFDHLISVAGLAALIVLSLSILLIIHNAIRLTIFARRREISIMEMVGATRVFISLPFLLEGIVYGAAGALVAGVLLRALAAAIARIDIPLLQTLAPILQNDFVVWQCEAWMIAAGLVFGLIGSWISLTRSLDSAAQI